MKLRKGHAEEHENHERWLVSYADFITLLFAFFVVMYAVSEVDAQKMKKLTGSVQFAFHFAGTGGTNEVHIFHGPPTPGLATRPVIVPELVANPNGKKEVNTHEARKLRKVGLKAAQILEAEEKIRQLDHVAEVEMQERGVVIRVAIDYLFDPGKADISPDALPLIDRIAEVMAATDHDVRVEGHADSTPIHNLFFPSNWELSTARATNLVRYFVGMKSLPPARFSASGYGEYRPIASNETPEGRARNRRVEIVLLSPAEREREPAGSAF